MDKDTKSFANLEPLVNLIVTTQHRRAKSKLINQYPSTDPDPGFHLQALDLIIDTIQKTGFAPQDTTFILSALQKCLNSLKTNTSVEWNRPLDALGTLIRRQGLNNFLYEEKSDLDNHVFEVLRCFPKDVLVNSLKSHKDYAVFLAICKFLNKQGELKANAGVVVSRLKEDFLVDKSKLTTRLTPYISKGILDDAVV